MRKFKKKKKAYPTTIVSDAHRTICKQNNINPGSKPTLSFINSIVQNFIHLRHHTNSSIRETAGQKQNSNKAAAENETTRKYQMVQPSRAGASNVHPGPFPHRVQAFQHLHVPNNPLPNTCHFQTIFNKTIN